VRLRRRLAVSHRSAPSPGQHALYHRAKCIRAARRGEYAVARDRGQHDNMETRSIQETGHKY
jgi:hypothetical protein